jgi:polysaccharide biosynthesis/export protein
VNHCRCTQELPPKPHSHVRSGHSFLRAVPVFVPRPPRLNVGRRFLRLSFAVSAWPPICTLAETMRDSQERRRRITRLAVLVGINVALFSPASAQRKAKFVNSKTPSSATTSVGTPPAGAVSTMGAGYRIGAGDVLAIVVRKEADASADSVVVRRDGVITVPFIKEIAAAGLSPRELEKVLTDRLTRFIREPDVTVVVKEVHSETVFVLGAVRKEGPISLAAPLTVLQAISAAGGLNDYAKKSKITILRVQDGKQIRIPFDYSAVVKGSEPDRNVFLAPGDTIVVP